MRYLLLSLIAVSSFAQTTYYPGSGGSGGTVECTNCVKSNSSNSYLGGAQDFSGASSVKPYRTLTTDWAGACSPNGAFAANTSTGTLFMCVAGNWAKVQGSGGLGGEAPNPANASKYFSTQFTSAGEDNQYQIVHSLGTRQIFPYVYDDTGKFVGYTDFTIIDNNNAVIKFAQPVTGSVLLVGYPLTSISAVSQQFTNLPNVNVAHNFGTSNIGVVVYDSTGKIIQFTDATPVDLNTVAISFSTPQTGSVLVVNNTTPAGSGTTQIIQQVGNTDLSGLVEKPSGSGLIAQDGSGNSSIADGAAVISALGSSLIPLPNLPNIPASKTTGLVHTPATNGLVVSNGSTSRAATSLDVPYDSFSQKNTSDVNMRAWRGKKAGRTYVAILGDSISNGFGATSNDKGYDRILTRAIHNAYGDGGYLVPAYGRTMTGTWSGVNGVGPSQTTRAVAYGTLASTYRATSSATIQFTGYGDSADIIYAQYTDSGSGFSVSVDGASKGTFGAATSGTYSVQRANIASIGDAPAKEHTITITAPSSGYAYIMGVVFYNGTSGVVILNPSLPGACSDQYNSTGKLNWMALFNPSLVVDMVETNDYYWDLPLATETANKTTAWNYAKNTLGASVLVVGEPLRTDYNNGAANAVSRVQNDYKTNIKNLITSSYPSLSYMDIADRWGDYATSNTAGLMNADKVHPSDSGHIDIAKAVSERLIDSTDGSGPHSITSSDGTKPALTIRNVGSGFSPLLFLQGGRNMQFPQMAIANDVGKTMWQGIGHSSETFFQVANKYYLYDPVAQRMRFVLDPATNYAEIRGGLFMTATDHGTTIPQPTCTSSLASSLWPTSSGLQHCDGSAWSAIGSGSGSAPTSSFAISGVDPFVGIYNTSTGGHRFRMHSVRNGMGTFWSIYTPDGNGGLGATPFAVNASGSEAYVNLARYTYLGWAASGQFADDSGFDAAFYHPSAGKISLLKGAATTNYADFQAGRGDFASLYVNGTAVGTGGSVTVPGSNNQVIFNSSGALGADAGFTRIRTGGIKLIANGADASSEPVLAIQNTTSGGTQYNLLSSRNAYGTFFKIYDVTGNGGNGATPFSINASGGSAYINLSGASFLGWGTNPTDATAAGYDVALYKPNSTTLGSSGNFGARKFVGIASGSLTAGRGSGLGSVGSQGTASVVGTDVAGQITATAGSGATPNNVIVQVYFGSAYATKPYCVIAPANSETMNTAWVDSNTASVMVYAATTLTNGTTYKWNYNCVQ